MTPATSVADRRRYQTKCKIRHLAIRLLAAGFENLKLTGSSEIDGTGNSVANVITGNGVKNTLSGLAGADTMDGGTGDDTCWAAATMIR